MNASLTHYRRAKNELSSALNELVKDPALFNIVSWRNTVMRMRFQKKMRVLSEQMTSLFDAIEILTPKTKVKMTPLVPLPKHALVKEKIDQIIPLIQGGTIKLASLTQLKKNLNELQQTWKNTALTQVRDWHYGMQTRELRTNPAYQALKGRQLSPTNRYFRPSPIRRELPKHIGLYVRSKFHPVLIKKLMKDQTPHIFYGGPDKKLNNGGHAHVGNYRNFMELLGDQVPLSDITPPTSTGSSDLYHAVLQCKTDLCKYIVEKLKGKLTHLTVGFYNDYPCVMVNVSRATTELGQAQKASDDAYAAWVDLLGSVLMGYIHHHAIQQKCPCEIERRSSFGFVVPTLAPTAGSLRINMGIVPQAFADCLILALKDLDGALKMMLRLKALNRLPKLPWDIFYNQPEYLEYRELETLPEVDNVFELLFTKVEKASQGKTAAQAAVRTSAMLAGVSLYAFNQQRKTSSLSYVSLATSVRWVVDQLGVKNGHLSVHAEEMPKPSSVFKDDALEQDDPAFWGLVSKIKNDIETRMAQYRDDLLPSTVAMFQSVLDQIDVCIAAKRVLKLHDAFERLHETFFEASTLLSADQDIGDGYGSDSDNEGYVESTKVFSKKLIVHNGMRALLAPVILASRKLGAARVYLSNAYYETENGITLIKELHGLGNVTVVKNISEANVVLHDLNACVTSGAEGAALDPNQLKTKWLILDTTSSQTQHIKPYLQRDEAERDKPIFLVDSGFKNQQFGSDKNQYGTIRIITQDKKVTESYYAEIKDVNKSLEHPISSPLSHTYRQLMKQLGFTPVTKSLLSETPTKVAKTEKAGKIPKASKAVKSTKMPKAPKASAAADLVDGSEKDIDERQTPKGLTRK